MIRFLSEYRRRRAHERFVEQVADFYATAEAIPFPELLGLFMAHVEGRDDVDPQKVRLLENGLGQHADRLERIAEERRLHGTQGLGSEGLQIVEMRGTVS